MPVTERGVASHRLEWPATGLDADRLRASGWRPTPFRQFLLKVHSRCNLACDYCYVYEMADQSWQRQPTVMSVDVIVRAATRIVEHAKRYHLPQVRVILHGGEPLLAGKGFFERLTNIFLDTAGQDVAIRFTIQSNGTLLNRPMLDELRASGIRIGISLDGGRPANDRHRRNHNGTSSYDRARQALALLNEPGYRPLFAGLLATIDVANDPVDTYTQLAAFAPPVVDFLLPHANWSTPPPRGISATPYADWLIAVFDQWFGAAGGLPVVRLFDSIIALLLGGHSSVESVGLTPTDVLVIETDGTIEHVDSLKSAFEGATSTGLNVIDDELSTLLDDPTTVARQLGINGLCDTCRSCQLVQVCGGGLYAHRYQAGSGFLNPSVYCTDLKRLIRHIAHQVRYHLSECRLSSPNSPVPESDSPRAGGMGPHS